METNFAGLDIARERLKIYPLFQYDPFSEDDDDGWLWQDFLMEVETWLDKTEDHIFVVQAEQIGWRNHKGYQIFSTDDPARFVRGVYGIKDDHSAIRFWEHKDADLSATVYHHDSPTGESRTIHTLNNWLRGCLKDKKLSELQKWLTENRISAWNDEWDDEVILGKKRRSYTKEDFVIYIRELYNEHDELPAFCMP